ncbi:hypothetical protein JYT89_02100 [Flavobacteriaceae bacterium AH-315-B10]|nr:hypothetical protein [Flavobacteriaceae bacterium AH-315-B10]
MFLGLSVITDVVLNSNDSLVYFMEDSLKFVGIFSWMLFFTTTSFRLLLKKTLVATS